MMKRVLALMAMSALASVALADVNDAIARDASVGAKGASVSGGRASVSGRGASVSASREGASVSGRGASVSASRDGASVRGGGASVTASRDGASVRAGGASVGASVSDSAHGTTASSRSGGFVNAAGDREYNDLASWIKDLERWWSGSEPKDNTGVDKGSATTNSSSVEQSGTTSSSSVKQVATSSSTDGGSAKASNTNVTRQN